MGKFDDALQELIDAGQLDEEAATRLRDASVVRKEAQDAEARATAAEERAQKAQRSIIDSLFKEVGASVKPDAVNFPNELDLLDRDAVAKWCEEQGVFPAKKPEGDPEGDKKPPSQIPPAEQTAHQEIAAAITGEAPPVNSLTDELNQAKSEAEVVALWKKHGRAVADGD